MNCELFVLFKLGIVPLNGFVMVLTMVGGYPKTIQNDHFHRLRETEKPQYLRPFLDHWRVRG